MRMLGFFILYTDKIQHYKSWAALCSLIFESAFRFWRHVLTFNFSGVFFFLGFSPMLLALSHTVCHLLKTKRAHRASAIMLTPQLHPSWYKARLKLNVFVNCSWEVWWLESAVQVIMTPMSKKVDTEYIYIFAKYWFFSAGSDGRWKMEQIKLTQTEKNILFLQMIY